MEDERLPVLHQATEMAAWDGAAQRGLIARQEREAIIASVLKEGLDFGLIPGVDKPVLKKAGAEKIADCLNLCPDYEQIQAIELWEGPLFHYRYRCRLMVRGSGVVVATGIGSCNSMEAKYRWRMPKLVCKSCGKETVIKGRAEFGGGWICWAKKGGCGAKLPDDAYEAPERVSNDQVFDQVNTIDKMGQKRSLVAAVLNLGFSEKFTQDLEDLQGTEEIVEKQAAKPPVQQPKAKTSESGIPSGINGTTWTGLIDTVDIKTGNTKGRPWTLYKVTGTDTTEFGTFDEKLYNECLPLAENGQRVRIEFNMTAKGSRNILSVVADDATESD